MAEHPGEPPEATVPVDAPATDGGPDEPGQLPAPAEEERVEDAGPDEPDDGVPAWLREPVEHSFEAPGQPEREMRLARRPTRRRRAERAATNPSADDVPDVAAPREPAPPDEGPRDRWMREQRPPHWD